MSLLEKRGEGVWHVFRSVEKQQLVISCNYDTRQGFRWQLGVPPHHRPCAQKYWSTHRRNKQTFPLQLVPWSPATWGQGRQKMEKARKRRGFLISIRIASLLSTLLFFACCWADSGECQTWGKPQGVLRPPSPKGHAQVTLLVKSSSGDQQGQPKGN